MNIVHEACVDDVSEPEPSSEAKGEVPSVASTLEQAIERARQLMTQYEIERVVVRDARSGKARDLVSATKKPAPRRRRRDARRRSRPVIS